MTGIARGARALCLLALAVFGACAPGGSAQATLAVRTSAVSNLVYQLDCVSRRIKSCGNREAYAALWKVRFGIDVDHDDDVAAWAGLKAQSPGTAAVGVTDPALLRTASFDAMDVDGYLEQIRPLLSLSECSSARRILARVRDSFTEWWLERADPPLARHVAALHASFASTDIGGDIDQLHRFFDIRSDDTTGLVIFLMRRVTPTPTNSAEMLGRYAVLEIDDDASVEQWLPVVLHEYTHFLFARMPGERMRALHNAILGDRNDSEARDRLAAWNLFNEALATAIGNGRIARRATPEDYQRRMSFTGGLYADADVDRAAKALLPVVDRALDSGATINAPSFARDYVDSVIAALGPRLRTTRLLLQELVLLDDPALSTAEDAFVPVVLKSLPANHSLWSYQAACCEGKFAKWWDFHQTEARLAIVRVAQRPAAAMLCGSESSATPGFSIRIVAGRPCMVVAADSSEAVVRDIRAIAAMEYLLPGDYGEPGAPR